MQKWWVKSKKQQPNIIAKSQHGLKWESFGRDVRSVLKTLHDAGFDAYVVGGCLRDHLLGHTPKDYDVVTNAKPEEIRRLFKRSLKIGRRFPLVHVYFSRYHYVEVVTFRGPKKWWCKHAWGSIDTDAVRRDFTVNALYLQYPKGDLIDYTGGYDDLKQGRIAMIGDPNMRYAEDPVRALRALRFSAKLGMAIEATTADGLKDALPMLIDVSPDRLYGEVLKAFYGGCGWKTYQVLVDHGVMDILFPGTINTKTFPKQANFIRTALNNADKRFLADESLSGAFLFAVLFWPAFQKKFRSYTRRGPMEARIKRAARSVALKHQSRVALPKRIHEAVVSIWQFQYQWGHKDNAQQLLDHPRFRAAFDFLVLRSQAGESVSDWLSWWETFCKENTPKRRHRR